MTPELYRALTTLVTPLIRVHLARRARRGKEDAARLDERWGAAGRARPEGALIWVHGASVGEGLSALPLAGRLLEARPDAHLLITTGTVTSAAMIRERLPERAFHQYVPVDLPHAVARFLDHWRPELVLWVESELWPNILFAIRERKIPLILVNGRMSDRSLARWRRFPGLIRPLLACFDLRLAQSEKDAGRFVQLGGSPIKTLGNLKYDAEPLAADEAALEGLRARCADRPRWLAASTHPGEEAIAASVHERLKRRLPNLLTIIVPRHADRGAGLAAELAARGLSLARRSAGEAPGAGTDLYLGDTMGELGLFYRLAPIAFVGGSLVPHGGQNPLEPARLGSALIFGPHMENFAEPVAAFLEGGAAEQVADEAALAQAVEGLIRNEAARARRAQAGRRIASEMSGALERVAAELEPFLPERVRIHAPA
ncbi:MAG: 3-deoxy-D-manno-octulosonic acid transferase [Alphaproteobacteria bacterium]